MKKIIIYLGIILCAFTSCSKDYSLEDGQQTTTPGGDLTRLPTTDPNAGGTPGTGGTPGAPGTGTDTTSQRTDTTTSPATGGNGGTTTNPGTGGSGGSAPTTSPYYMRFKVDGVEVEYKRVVLAFNMHYDKEYSVSVQGQNMVTNNPPGLSLIVTDKFPIVTKTYYELNNNSISSIQFRNDGGYDFSSGFVEQASGLKTIITELTSTGVKGTFSGKVANLNGTKTLNITDGVFYAKF